MELHIDRHEDNAAEFGTENRKREMILLADCIDLSASSDMLYKLEAESAEKFEIELSQYLQCLLIVR